MGENENILLTRKELYEQIWATPVQKLAKEYGLSDVGLAKICKKHNIPRPPLGYWARLQHGYSPRKPLLPPSQDTEQEIVSILKRSRPSVLENPSQEFASALAAEKSFSPISVSEGNAINMQAIVRKTVKALRSRDCKPDQFGILRRHGLEILDFEVSRKSLERAANIFNVILDSFEKRGFPLKVSSNGKRVETRVKVLGENLRIWVKEETKREERRLTNAEKWELESKPFTYIPNRYNYVCTGRLSLCLDTDCFTEGFRKSWSDGDKQKLENCINSFLSGIIKAAELTRIARERHEKIQKEREEESRRYHEEQERKRKEEERRKVLEQQSDSWHRSQRIREFVKAVAEREITRNGKVDADEQTAKWIEWAKGYADTLDPLR